MAVANWLLSMLKAKVLPPGLSRLPLTTNKSFVPLALLDRSNWIMLVATFPRVRLDGLIAVPMVKVPAAAAPPGRIVPFAPLITPFALTRPVPPRIWLLTAPTVKAPPRPVASKIPGLVTLMLELLEMSPVELKAKVPLLIVVVPAYVLKFDRIHFPAPVLMTWMTPFVFEPPPITPETSPLPAPCSVKYRSPEKVCAGVVFDVAGDRQGTGVRLNDVLIAAFHEGNSPG